MPNLHPLIIHFPIVLLYLAVASEVAFRIFKTDYLKKTASYMLGLGVISLSLAVLSGWLAHQNVPHSELSFPVIEKHQLLGFVTLGGFLIASILKYTAIPQINHRWLKTCNLTYLGLCLVSITTLTLTAHFGGQLVYEYGVGVKVVNHQALDTKSNPNIDMEFEKLLSE